ncbi:MAG: HNH endonuclease signature motif containing protein, partial [Actinomycetota bacterium]
GCTRPVNRCDIDHHTEWHQGGRTDQANALPLCPTHNRHKHRTGSKLRSDDHETYARGRGRPS